MQSKLPHASMVRRLFSSVGHWHRARRLRHRDELVRKLQQRIDHLEHELKLGNRDREQLLLVNARNNERVAWEVAHFSRRLEIEKYLRGELYNRHSESSQQIV